MFNTLDDVDQLASIIRRRGLRQRKAVPAVDQVDRSNLRSSGFRSPPVEAFPALKGAVRATRRPHHEGRMLGAGGTGVSGQDAQLRSDGKALGQAHGIVSRPMQDAVLLVGGVKGELRDRSAADVAQETVSVVALLLPGAAVP